MVEQRSKIAVIIIKCCHIQNQIVSHDLKTDISDSDHLYIVIVGRGLDKWNGWDIENDTLEKCCVSYVTYVLSLCNINHKKMYI